MIEIRDLKKQYRDRTVLDLPFLRVGQGETMALAGANGSGKTTLLRILAGRLSPSSGTVQAAKPVLYLPQQSYAFRGTVLDNMLLGARDKEEEAVRLLNELQLGPLQNKKAASLSGGELQRLAFCRLLLRPCSLLLLDEPTSACDATGTQLLLTQLDRYRAKTGCTVIISTHTPAVALQVADRLLILNAGRAEADGKPDAVLHNPETDWARAFIAGWKI